MEQNAFSLPPFLSTPSIIKETQLAKTLSRGDRGTAVRRAQEWLTLHGLGLKPDGSFGPATEEATRTFQTRRNLPVTGRVDAITFRAMTSPLLSALARLPSTGNLGRDAALYAEQHLAQHPREVGGQN